MGNTGTIKSNKKIYFDGVKQAVNMGSLPFIGYEQLITLDDSEFGYDLSATKHQYPRQTVYSIWNRMKFALTSKFAKE